VVIHDLNVIQQGLMTKVLLIYLIKLGNGIISNFMCITNGVRGIVKTKDFVTYANAGINDATFGKSDMLSWRESWNNPIGIGAGNTLKEGDKYYTVVEGADKGLACATNQNWDVGIFRTNNLTSTNWEQYPERNPIFYSDDLDPQVCNIQYVSIFRSPDGGINYFQNRDGSNNLEEFYFYKLYKKQSILKNGDFWKCFTEDWGGSSINVQNYFGDKSIKIKNPIPQTPTDSSDGNCRLNLDCGIITCLNQTLFQFADLPTDKNAIYFDLKAKSKGGAGKFQVRVFLRDKNNAVISEFTKVFDTTTNYQTFKGSTIYDAGITKVSYEIMPISGNLFFDENNLIPFSAVIKPPQKSIPQNLTHEQPTYPFQPPASWKIMSFGDFNADGKQDLVWRDTNTGQIAIWLLNGQGKFYSGAVDGASSLPIDAAYVGTLNDQNWQVVTTGDLNGDGSADFIWRHKVSGENAVWYLGRNGLTYLSGASFPTATDGKYLMSIADQNWKIAATTDTNNDGKADLIWRNDTTAEIRIWQMNGDQILLNSTSITHIAPGWVLYGAYQNIAQIGSKEYTLQWREIETNTYGEWYMKEYAFKSGAVSISTIIPTDYKVLN
jgi:hypothetical protein